MMVLGFIGLFEFLIVYFFIGSKLFLAVSKSRSIKLLNR